MGAVSLSSPAKPHYGSDGGGKPLPAGWVAKMSERTGQMYYYHAQDGRTQWETPASRPVPSDQLMPGTPFKISSGVGGQVSSAEVPPDEPTNWGKLKLPPLHAKLPELMQTRRVPMLPAMTGLTATLQESKRRIEENSSKMAQLKEQVDANRVVVAPQPQAMAERPGGDDKVGKRGWDLLKRDVAERREVVPRQLRHALIAYTYGLVIGIFCSFLIAATAVNFGPEKTLEWLAATGLSMVWRLFVIDPIKVLFCGGFEGVAGLITGEADSWCAPSFSRIACIALHYLRHVRSAVPLALSSACLFVHATRASF
jgi:hypothetical protein